MIWGAARPSHGSARKPGRHKQTRRSLRTNFCDALSPPALTRFGCSTKMVSHCAAGWYARTNLKTAVALFASMPGFLATHCARCLAAWKYGKRKERATSLRAFLLWMAERPQGMWPLVIARGLIFWT